MNIASTSTASQLQPTTPENSIEGFLSSIDMTPIDWDSIDTSKIPEDCYTTPIDVEFERFITDVQDDASCILDDVYRTENNIKARAKELNEAVYNTMKRRANYLSKLDDEDVCQTVIDSTIKYKNSRHLNNLYQLYRRLNDKDIRKFCYVEIHSLYVHQIRKSIVKNNKMKRAERNKLIFECIDAGMRYIDIANKFSLSEISIKKLAQKHRA